MEKHGGGAKKDILRESYETDRDGQRETHDVVGAKPGDDIVSTYVCIFRMC